jgi:nitroreductase
MKEFSMNEQIKRAIDVSQKAQRNYDLSRSIPDYDLQTLIYAATNSPSKQNETHYELKIYTDQNIIQKIYNDTKLFSIGKDPEDFIGQFGEKNGKFWQDESKSVRNSQILANAVFVYIDDEGPARGGTHKLGKETNNKDSESYVIYNEQKNYSIGVSAGQLVMSAALLGYKTGFCSAFNKRKVSNTINTNREVKLLIGVGYENFGVNRRLHAETLNKDLPEKFRTGELDEPWQFPSFKKYIKVSINET